jgi:adapter protein MecA 1/2
VFQDLSEVTRLAHVLGTFYTGKNDLYKNEASHKYYLMVSKSSQSPEDFNKVCNILSEYAMQQTFTPAVKAFFGEHYQIILKENALQTLAEL